MNSIQQLLGMVATEASAPLTHQCHGCGQIFSQESDGCPHCGRSARAMLLPELRGSEEVGTVDGNEDGQ